MKKILTLALCALMLLVPAAFAQEPPFEPLPPLPPLEVEIIREAGQARSLPVSEEVVDIQQDIFTITSKGVTSKLQVPFGWYGFSQDVARQLDAYMNIFNNPRGAMDYVFALDLSLLLIDSQTNNQMMFFTRANQLSGFFVSMESPETHEAVFAYFSKNAPNSMAEKLEIAGRPFVKTEEIDSSGTPTLVIFTYHNGVMLGFQLLPEDGAINEGDLQLLSSFVETLEIL